MVASDAWFVIVFQVARQKHVCSFRGFKCSAMFCETVATCLDRSGIILESYGESAGKQKMLDSRLWIVHCSYPSSRQGLYLSGTSVANSEEGIFSAKS